MESNSIHFTRKIQYHQHFLSTYLRVGATFDDGFRFILVKDICRRSISVCCHFGGSFFVSGRGRLGFMICLSDHEPPPIYETDCYQYLVTVWMKRH